MNDKHLDMLEEIASAIGFRGAYRLSMIRAGTSFYLPANPPPGHWIRSILADDEVTSLVGRFGRDTISIPPLPDATEKKIQVAILNGMHVRDIALLTGKSERYVWMVKQGMAEEADDKERA